MNLTRIRCPACGTRLNEGTLDREIEFGDGKDVIIQNIGGRGSIETISSSDFTDDNDTRILYDKVKAAYEYLSEILGLDDDDDEDT